MSNFNKATRQELEALNRLNAPEMHHLLVLFNRQLEETDKALRVAVDTHFVRLQGRAQYLQELLDSVKEAGSALDRMGKK